jgi:hypothetical protein
MANIEASISVRRCITNQLVVVHNIDMKEGTDIEEKISKARDLENLLAMLGEPIPERTLVNLLLNKLPHCYEDVIQNLSTMDVMPSLRGQAPS